MEVPNSSNPVERVNLRKVLADMSVWISDMQSGQYDLEIVGVRVKRE